MKHQADISALTQLTGASFASCQSQMATLRRQESALRDTVTSLDMARRTRAAGLSEADPALLAGADLLWQSWIEQRRAALNEALSRNRVAQEAARGALAVAFGRDQVTRTLSSRVASDRIRARTRRDEASS
jgi:hypothetical protein